MPSSSSTSFFSFDSELEEDDNLRGFPKTCRCGCRVVIRTSRTPRNPGRLFHTCEKIFEARGFHTWKWTDVSLVEEVQDIKSGIHNRDKFHDEEILLLKAQIRGCEKMIGGLKEEVKRVKKLIVVAGIVVLGCVFYVSK